MNGSVVGIYLYYDGSIEYFGKKHLPYAILALFVIITFVLFPLMLLLLYPIRCCQKCLGHCKTSWHALYIFIDAFQGCLKDGTNGTWNCRYFAGVHCLLCYVNYCAYNCSHVAYYISALQSRTLFVDSVLILTIAMWYGTVVFFITASVTSKRLLHKTVTVLFLIAALPLLYLVVIFLHWIYSHMGVGQRLVKRIKRQMRRFCIREHGTRLDETLPDRLINLRVHDDDGFSDQPYMGIHSGETTTTL